jgi:energy-coupling factor transport system permease protein
MKAGFASFHPVVCFVYYVNLFLFSMLFLHPFFLVTILAAAVALNGLQHQGERMKRSFPFFLIIGLVFFIMNPLISHRGTHILFYIGSEPITLESVLYGWMMMMSLLAIVTAFLSYNRIITADKFLFLFSSLSPKAALLTMMAARFVPLLQRRFSELALIQRTRGLNPQTGSVKKRAAEGMQLLQLLLSSSLEEAMQTADSVKARGYGTSKRTAYFPYRMGTMDWTVLGLLVLSAGLAYTGWLFGWGRLQIYPELESVWFTSYEWLTYIAACLFLVIPLVIEGREEIRWRFLK